MLRGVLRPRYTEVLLSKEDSDFVQENKGLFWRAFGSGASAIDGVPVAGFVAAPAGAPAGPLIWGRDNGDETLDISAGSFLELTYQVEVTAPMPGGGAPDARSTPRHRTTPRPRRSARSRRDVRSGGSSRD